MKTIVLFLFSFLFVASAFAQPERYGCHYYRNLHDFQSPKKLTQAQLKDLEGSIARSDTFNIVHYDLALDVTDYNGNYLKGIATIDVVALEPDRMSITFDLMALNVDSVTSSGASLNFTHDGLLLQVYFDEAPVVDENLELTVFYQGNPHQDPQWGGFYFESDYIYNLGIGLTTVPPNFGKVWYPCFDTFVERATYTYHVKSAGGKVAFCQGELVEDLELDGDTVLRSFEFEHQLPTYLSAIAVSNYETDWSVHSGVFGDYDVSLTAKPNNVAGMVNVFQDLGYAIDALEYWWGPYVWGRVGYILTTDGALEIPNNIAYPQFMVNESLISNGRLFSHELGHHWWGNHTTMRTHRYVDEGRSGRVQRPPLHRIERWARGIY
jgi:aminopeptidase N